MRASNTDPNKGIITLDGVSRLENGSYLNIGGEHYPLGPVNINGTLLIDGGSFVNVGGVQIGGHGTIEINDGSNLGASEISAGLRINVNDGGRMTFGGGPNGDTDGVIHLAAGGVVDAFTAGAATSEVFNSHTGILDLLNASNGVVASVQFAGDARIYAMANGIGGINLTTTHAVGDLPVTFGH